MTRPAATATVRPDVLATLAKLPARCFTTMDSCPGQVIELRRGVMGYFHVAIMPADAAAACAAAMNAALDPPPSEVQIVAMSIGSIFGWDVPGADPSHHGRTL